jgi:hypothetical protein
MTGTCALASSSAIRQASAPPQMASLSFSSAAHFTAARIWSSRSARTITGIFPSIAGSSASIFGSASCFGTPACPSAVRAFA